ncbi:MAG: sulfite exporter TauE/SafE family protein [Desulfobaccales bacterium]
MPPGIIALASLVVVLSFMVRGLTGFGSGPVMVSFLLLFFEMKLVAPSAAILAVLTGFLLLFTFQTRKWVRYDLFLYLIPSYMAGIVVGTYGLVFLKGSLVKMLFGIFITGYAAMILFFEKEKKESKETSNYAGVVAGFFGGITGGLFSAGGPPVVLYLTGKIKEKNAMRATLVFLFLLMDSWRIILFFFAGLISSDVLKFTVWLVPAFVIGNIAGSLLHIKVNERLFKRLVALVLMTIGLVLVFSSGGWRKLSVRLHPGFSAVCYAGDRLVSRY